MQNGVSKFGADIWKLMLALEVGSSASRHKARLFYSPQIALQLTKMILANYSGPELPTINVWSPIKPEEASKSLSMNPNLT